MGMRVQHALIWGLLLAALGLAPAAQGEVAFNEGHWRLELAGYKGLEVGSHRDGDTLITGTVEYEFPAADRCTLGLRILPLFMYDEADHGCNEFWDEEDYDTLWGGGIGLSTRFYAQREEYRGLFLEVTGDAIVHEGYIEGNGSNLNFMTGLGIGFECKANWHVTLRIAHLSNANLDGDNDGSNVLGLAFGYRF